MKWYYLVGVTISVMVITMFIRIPLPSKGYFNFGDVAVVFSGLYLGRKGGLIAGGLGSCLADLVSPYAIFAPLTLVAKGLEGLFCGFAKHHTSFLRYAFVAVGVLSMVCVYFVGFTFVKPYGGIGSALAELIPNIIQAIGGYIGGFVLYKVIVRHTNLVDK